MKLTQHYCPKRQEGAAAKELSNDLPCQTLEKLGREGGRGVLYVCATPIGNLEDVTLRLLRVLKEVDFIAAEDTRTTLKLLHHYGIKTPILSFHQHSHPRRVSQIIKQLTAGQQAALVTNAGTPCISDPGAPLVRAALEAGIRVVPVPGPSAVTAVLSASTFPCQQFLFLGFLPRKPSQRRSWLERIKTFPFPLVLYEAPHRLIETLGDLLEILGNRRVVLGRELTKQHEEVTLTCLSNLLERYSHEPPIGEFSLVIEGLPVQQESESKSERAEAVDWEAVNGGLAHLRAQGLSLRDAARQVGEEFGLPWRTVYRRALAHD